MATTTVAAAAVIENDIVVVVAANRKRIIIPTGERRRERGDLLLIYAEEEMRQVNPSPSQAGYTHTITNERKRERERERYIEREAYTCWNVITVYKKREEEGKCTFLLGALNKIKKRNKFSTEGSVYSVERFFFFFSYPLSCRDSLSLFSRWLMTM
jgi:hypothetical protein